jgi:hypothetical protein
MTKIQNFFVKDIWILEISVCFEFRLPAGRQEFRASDLFLMEGGNRS